VLPLLCYDVSSVANAYSSEASRGRTGFQPAPIGMPKERIIQVSLRVLLTKDEAISSSLTIYEFGEIAASSFPYGKDSSQ